MVRQASRVPLHRTPIARFIAVHRHLREGNKVFQRDEIVGIHQPSIGSNDEGARNALWRAGEGLRVSQLSPEIEPAQKAKEFAESDPLAAVQLSGQRELGLWIQD